MCPAGTGVRDMRKVVDLLIGERDPRAGVAIDQDAGRARHACSQAADEGATEARRREGRRDDRFRDRRGRSGRKGHRLFVLRRADADALAKDVRRCGRAADRARRRPTKRQALVDRFQNDDRIRVFLANIIAGGIGTQPDRGDARSSSTISTGCPPTTGRPRTAPIASVRRARSTSPIWSAADTVDDFVQSVLETKSALVNAVVEGKALAPDLSGDVLDELQRALRAISPGLADTTARRQTTTT